MPLEAVVICLDNSEFNRNGDFRPSRFDCQQEAANYISEAKLQQNPETTIGAMSIAGIRVDVRMTQTMDIGELNQAINGIQISK